jgi:hypothetical protein
LEALESLQKRESLQKIEDCMKESLKCRDLAGDERYTKLRERVLQRLRSTDRGIGLS